MPRASTHIYRIQMAVAMRKSRRGLQPPVHINRMTTIASKPAPKNRDHWKPHWTFKQFYSTTKQWGYSFVSCPPILHSIFVDRDWRQMWHVTHSKFHSPPVITSTLSLANEPDFTLCPNSHYFSFLPHQAWCHAWKTCTCGNDTHSLWLHRHKHSKLFRPACLKCGVTYASKSICSLFF